MDVPTSFKPEKKDLEGKTEQLKEKANLRSKTELEEILEEFNNPNHRASETLHPKVKALIDKHNYKEISKIDAGYFYYHVIWSKQDGDNYKVFIKNHYCPTSIGYSFTTVTNLDKFCEEFRKYEQGKKKEIKLPLLWYIGSGAGSAFWGASFYSAIQFLTFLPKNPQTMLSFAIGAGLIGTSIIPLINWRRKRRREKLYNNIIMNDREAVEEAFT